MISKAAGFHTNHTKARLLFSHSSEVMPETDSTVKSHCYMDEEMKWLLTIKQSQDREKMHVEAFSTEFVQCKIWSFVRGLQTVVYG